MSRLSASTSHHLGTLDRADARRPYIEAVSSSDAGRIDLELGDDPVLVRRLLTEAARELDVRIGSFWAEPDRVLLWRRVAGYRVRHR